MLSTIKLIFSAGIIIALIMITLELVISRTRKKRVYTLADTLTNLSSGMIERSFDVFIAIGFFFIVNYIYQELAPWKIPSNPLTWFVALLVTDFLAYWHHRLSHEINFLWAAHVTHHSSEELNVTTVFRVSFVAVLNRAAFFIWMPFMGFDPLTIVTTGMFLGIYQFFTHFRFIDKVGMFETFMTTPSHHRVHHSRNEKYLDKNYAHIFIFWDKLFGTFMAEEEEPDFGITSGFQSSNAFNATFDYWVNMFTRASRTKGLKNKAKVFLKGPEFTPEDTPHLPPVYKSDKKGERIQYRNLFSIEKSAYVLMSVLTSFGLFFWLTRIIVPKPGGGGAVSVETARLFLENAYQFIFQPHILLLIGLILFSILAEGIFMDGKKGSGLIEAIRLVAMAIILPFIFSQIGYPAYLTKVVIAVSVVMFAWMLRIKYSEKKLSIANN